MQLKKTITVTADRKRYTLGAGDIALIEARRANARGCSPRDNAMRLKSLRGEVAKRLGTDLRTASLILRSVRYGDLFV